MKRLAFTLAWLLIAVSGFAQNNGVLMPALPPSFLNGSGLVAASAKLCSLKAGTSSTFQSVYSDSALGSALPNPTSLNALGIPQTGGGQSTQVYMSPGTPYKFILYAAGTGNTCNGTAVGSAIWTRDNVYDFAGLPSFANIRLCDRFPGATAGLKIAACIADLPSAGGTADARGLQGSQTITATLSSSKAIHLIFGSGTYTFTGTTAIAQLGTGSIIEGQGMSATTLVVSTNGPDGINPQTGMIIRNLTIQGNTTLTSGANGIDGCNCDGVLIDNVEVKNFGEHGINTGNISTGWRITNSNVHDNKSDGILLASGVSGMFIGHNRVHENGSNGIDNTGLNNIISDNDVYLNGSRLSGTGVDCEGILLASVISGAYGGNADKNIVDGNRIRDNYCKQIALIAQNSGTVNYNTISNNVITRTTQGLIGINFDTSVGATCGTSSFNSVTGNIITGMSQQGILSGGGSGIVCTVDKNAIKDNIVQGNTGIGIYILIGTSNVVSNNIALANTAGNITIAGARNGDFCNLVDNSLNECAIATGNLAVGNIVVATTSGLSAVTFTGSGNTEIDIKSTGAGRNNYGTYIDASGNWNFRDVTNATDRAKFDSTGALTVNGASVFGSTVSVSVLTTATGNHVCYSTNNMLATCTSKREYKENIQPLTSDWGNAIMRLVPVAFTSKISSENQLGFIADDVEMVEPRLANYYKGKLNGVDYDAVVAALVKLVQDQEARIRALEQR